MGRRTWESIGKALPGRTTVVISRGTPALPEGVRRAGSLDEAIAVARGAGDDEAFVAGGAEIYRHALTIADRLHLTRVHAEPEGDTFFPHWDAEAWPVVESERHPADTSHPFAYTFEVRERARR